jgi:hypothetical protein
MADHNQALSMLVVRSPDEPECLPDEVALRISEIELMVGVLRVWTVEEGRIPGVPVLF